MSLLGKAYPVISAQTPPDSNRLSDCRACDAGLTGLYGRGIRRSFVEFLSVW